MTPGANLILRHLENKGSITPLEAIGVHGVMRLAPRIHEIRKSGIDVSTDMHTDMNGKKYARYRLAS